MKLIIEFIRASLLPLPWLLNMVTYPNVGELKLNIVFRGANRKLASRKSRSRRTVGRCALNRVHVNGPVCLFVLTN